MQETNEGVDIAMKISTFKYFTIDAGKSLKRNKTLSFASIATVAATLFIFGIFMLMVQNVNLGMEKIGSNLEAKIVLEDDITISEKSTVEKTLKNIEGVSEVIYESKAKALEKAKEMFGEESTELMKGFENQNPFPNMYIIKVKKPEYLTNVVSEVSDLPGVETVREVRELVDKFIQFSSTVKWLGVLIFSILFIVSLFLINNTIKLTVYSRKREIGIMKYVGATDWFIRWPFIIEGMIIGVLGSLISTLGLYYAYKLLFSKTAEFLGMMQLVSPAYVLGNLMLKFILSGIIIGAFGSIISIRKFLKV